MSRIGLATLTLATTVLLAACGSSGRSVPAPAPNTSSVAANSSTPATQGPFLSRAAITAKANAICRQTSERRKLIKAKSETELELALPQMAAYQQAMSEELGKLKPPSSMTADWNQMVTNSQAMGTALNKLYEGARANANPKSGQPLWNSLYKALEGIQSAARRQNIRTCARF